MFQYGSNFFFCIYRIIIALQPTYYIFLNVECKDRYEEDMHTRGLFYGWGMVIRDIKEYFPNIYTWLKDFRCDILIDLVPQHNEVVIWEFYANLLTLEWSVPLPIIFVKGKKVLVNVDTMNDTLGVLNPTYDTFKVRVQA